MPNPQDARLAVVERELMRIWSEVLKADQIDLDQSIFALGGDSISSLLIATKALSAGIRITALQVLEKETIAQLAEVAELVEEAEGEAGLNDNDVDSPVGETKLTPIQEWFFEQDIPDINYWHMAAFVEVQKELDEKVLGQALARIIEHHDALRSRFSRRDGKWVQFIAAAAGELRLNVVDTRTLDSRCRLERIRQASLEACSHIDIAHGSLVTAVLAKTPNPSPGQMLLVVHHLVLDSVSMRVLIQDLETACGMLAAGEEVALPAKTTPVRSWAGQLERYSMSPAILDQLNYWRAVPQAEFASANLGDQPDALTRKNTCGRTRTVSVKVPPQVVSGLIDNGYRVAGATLQDALLAGLLLAWREQTGRASLQLDLEGHGREPLDRRVDLTRTVGWFTAIYPAVLHVPGSGNGIDALRSIHQQLDRIPGKGIGYGLLRYLAGSEDAALARLAQSQVSFNYLGWFDGSDDNHLFGSPMRVPVPLQDSEAPRRYLLEIVSSGAHGAIDIDFIYGTDFFLERSVRTLANRCLNMLEKVALTLVGYPD